MAYATLADFDLFGPAALHSSKPEFDPGRKGAVIDAVSDQFDTYFAQLGLAVPIQSHKRDLVKANIYVASWELMAARGTNRDNPAMESLHSLYEDAWSWVKDIGKELADLQKDTGGGPRKPNTGIIGVISLGDSDGEPRGW